MSETRDIGRAGAAPISYEQHTWCFEHGFTDNVVVPMYSSVSHTTSTDNHVGRKRRKAWQPWRNGCQNATFELVYASTKTTTWRRS